MELVKKFKAWRIGTNFPEKWLTVWLFLFPVFSLSIRHWLSGIFSILALSSLRFAWSTTSRRLHKEEKYLFGVFAFYLASIVITSTASGWTEGSIHRLGAEIKYLFFLPLYMYLRQYPAALKWLFVGVPFGAVVLGLQALYDVAYGPTGLGKGIYGPIIFGDLGALLLIFTIILAIDSNNRKPAIRLLYVLAIVFAGVATYLSGSRNAWLAGVVGLLFLPFCWRRILGVSGLLKILAVIIAIIVTAVVLAPGIVIERADKLVNELERYKRAEEMSVEELKTSSSGFRLEQWKTALILIKAKPLLGHGPGNTGKNMNRLVDAGIAHKALYDAPSNRRGGHVHNAYIEMLISMGVTGFLAWCALLLYPLWVFWRNRGYNSTIASMGVFHIACFLIFSLTEIPFIHDNFSSIFLLYLGTLFAWIMHDKYGRRVSMPT